MRLEFVWNFFKFLSVNFRPEYFVLKSLKNALESGKKAKEPSVKDSNLGIDWTHKCMIFFFFFDEKNTIGVIGVLERRKSGKKFLSFKFVGIRPENVIFVHLLQAAFSALKTVPHGRQRPQSVHPNFWLTHLGTKENFEMRMSLAAGLAKSSR